MAYEERGTIWRAGSFEEAVEMAEREAEDYAQTLDAEYLGLAQSSISVLGTVPSSRAMRSSH